MDPNKLLADPDIQRVVQQTQQAQQLQAIVHDLNEKCWETCVDRPGPKMDGKTQNCLKNCVDRFIDANLLVTRHLEKKAESILNQHDDMQN